MASYLRPRRGKKAAAETQLIGAACLKRGEIFFELPDTGIGTGSGKIKFGDGSSNYSDLKYFLEPTDLDGDSTVISFTDSSSPESDPYTSNPTHTNAITPTASLKTIFTNIKQLLLNYNNQLTTINSNVNELGKTVSSGLYVGMVVMGANLTTEEIVIGIYGGTSWTQITDKFLIGASSTYKVNTTGGSSTHTITTNEMPSHTHTFSGTQGSTGDETVDHKHTYTPSGTISNTKAPSFTGTKVSTTENDTSHSHAIYNGLDNTESGKSRPYQKIADSKVTYDGEGELYGVIGFSYNNNKTATETATHKHTVTASGTVTAGTYSFSGTASSTNGVSAKHQHKFTPAGTNSNTGSGASMSILNPYYAVYIWVRTA